MISYAQNFEDVMLWRVLKHVKRGFYIDVGAWSPNEDSVTRWFYDAGWRGINIEPNPVLHEQLNEHRPEDINLKIALSDYTGKQLMNFTSNTGLSTLDNNVAEKHRKSGWEISRQEVDISSLSQVWLDNIPPDQDVHFLKVDVEGLEEAVLRGNDWVQHRPWIVVVEATLPMTQIESYKHWENLLRQADYLFAYADGLNRFYVAKEQKKLKGDLKYPPNVFDDFRKVGTQQALDVASAAQSQLDALQARFDHVQTEAQAKVEKAEAVAQNDLREAERRHQETSAALNEQLQQRDAELAAATKQLEQALDVASAAQSQLDALQARFDHVQTEAQAKVEKAEAVAQNDLREAERRHQETSAALNEQLQQRDAELAAATKQLEQALDVASAAQSQLDALQARFDHVQTEAQTKVEKAEAVAQKKLREAQRGHQKTYAALNNRLLERDVELTAAARRLEQALEIASEAQVATNEVRVKLADTREELHKTQQTNYHQMQLFQATRAELDSVLQANHHHWQLAEARLQQINLLTRSNSWRITAPLRALSRIVRGLLKLPLLVIRWALRPIALIVARFVLKRPQLRARFGVHLRRFPTLFAHARQFAIYRGLYAVPTAPPLIVDTQEQIKEPAQTQHANKIEVDLSTLTPHVRQIYADLNRVLDHDHKDNH